MFGFSGGHLLDESRSSENRLKTQSVWGWDVNPGSLTRVCYWVAKLWAQYHAKTVTPEAAVDGRKSPDTGTNFHGFKMLCWQFRLHAKRKHFLESTHP